MPLGYSGNTLESIDIEAALEQQQKLQLENIEAIDAGTYPTKRNQLLQSLEHGIAKKIEFVRG